MSLLKRIHDAVERKNAVVVPEIDTVSALHEHVKKHSHVETIPPVALDMCVLSIKSFDRGWRCVLIDKEAAGEAFPLIKHDYDQLKYREQGEFVFRLTIWRGKKYPGREPNFVQGEVVLIKEVSGFKTYSGVLQGIADMDDFIKDEAEDAQGYKKKAKTSTNE